MISRSNLKFIIGLSLIGLLILFPDLVLWLYHSLLELGLILFELLEEALDIIIETLFGTGLHETQIIVFYIIMAIGLLGLYKLIRTVPRWYHTTTQRLVNFYSAEIAAWQQLSLFEKIKWLTILMAGLYGLSFLLF